MLNFDLKKINNKLYNNNYKMDDFTKPNGYKNINQSSYIKINTQIKNSLNSISSHTSQNSSCTCS